MLYGTEDIGRDLLHQPNKPDKPDKLRKDEFWAVDGVSFEVKRGECLGTIGAGKSTLLKMLNGIFMPDKGKITIKAKSAQNISPNVNQSKEKWYRLR